MTNNNCPICEIDFSGTERWTLNEKFHREDGPAIIYLNREKLWYLHGKLHRIGGPAIEYNGGTKCWYFYGELHRLDGPAYESYSGYKEWWYHNKLVNCSSQKEFERLIKLKVLW